MTIIYSEDRTTVTRRMRELPREHWEQLADDPEHGPVGRFHELTPGNAEDYGYFVLREFPPEQDSVKEIINDADGFREIWIFDQTRQDNRITQEVAEAKGTAVDNAVSTLRQWALDAEGTTVSNGNNTAVTQTMVNRLGVFFDRFADLIESDKL